MVKKGTIVDAMILPSAGQKKHNRKLSRARAGVVPTCWDAGMKIKALVVVMRAKNQARNRLRFLLTCTMWNVSRAAFLVRGSQMTGVVAP